MQLLVRPSGLFIFTIGIGTETSTNGKVLNSLTAMARICSHFFFELRMSLITIRCFVRCQRLIARNDRELFSVNRGVSHLNEARRIDELIRGSVLGYEILVNN